MRDLAPGDLAPGDLAPGGLAPGGLAPGVLAPGVQQLHFDTGAWFAAAGRSAFYPEVAITFAITDDDHHHRHVPLLLSPYAFSTYRGS